MKYSKAIVNPYTHEATDSVDGVNDAFCFRTVNSSGVVCL